MIMVAVSFQDPQSDSTEMYHARRLVKAPGHYCGQLDDR